MSDDLSTSRIVSTHGIVTRGSVKAVATDTAGLTKALRDSVILGALEAAERRLLDGWDYDECHPDDDFVISQLREAIALVKQP